MHFRILEIDFYRNIWLNIPQFSETGPELKLDIEARYLVETGFSRISSQFLLPSASGTIKRWNYQKLILPNKGQMKAIK